MQVQTPDADVTLLAGAVLSGGLRQQRPKEHFDEHSIQRLRSTQHLTAFRWTDSNYDR
jgi:hypothetical protein